MDLDDEELKATRMMNGADRKGRVNKMKQDIEILEELKNIFLSLKYHGYINDVKKDISTDGVINAIENILKERQQDKEKIKELEEERQIVGMPVRNKRDGRIGIVLHQWKSGSVAVLESINPRVINTHDSWNTLEIVTDEVKQTQTKCETIPVSLVEEKIEEIKNETWYIDCGVEAKQSCIEVLQELLEKRK